MRVWFEALDLREQYFVAVGAVVVAIALLYLIIWAPLDRKHAQLKEDVDVWQSSLSELRPLRTASGSKNSSAFVTGCRRDTNPDYHRRSDLAQPRT